MAAQLQPRTRQLVIMLIVSCALFMQNLDSTIIATALPTIGRSIGESPLRLNVAITCYLLSLAVFIPISGWTADRFGARRVFTTAIVVFTIGSIGCGLSQSLWMLVVARIVQGMGGAMMVPVGRLVLLKTVPRSELVRAMSYVSIPALIGPVFGPPLGGLIVTYGSWRWIFFINIPIGALGVLLINMFVENLREATVRPFDLPGFLLTGIGLATLAFGFETIGRGQFPLPVVIGLMALGAACLTLYWRHARRVDYPIIDLALMRIPTYAMTTIGGFIFRMGMGALPFLMPLMLQVGFGLDALSSGLLTFASALGAMTMKATVTTIIRTFGFRPVLTANTVFCSSFLFSYSFFRPTTPHFVIFLALLAGGFFRSLQMTSINTLSYADVPPAMLSRATSVTSMAQQLSQSVGVGTAALLLYARLATSGETTLTAPDFSFALATVGIMSMLSVPFFLRMSPDAGAEVAGRIAPKPQGS
ncbi:MAG TPA: DHA2 family efflux MFS transporter permease subunit [Stellaceae bacterium]|jgi:EmrB/QacA subfamily drug resistance transporter|nr:DHA2 family efflux MFS transporter permease subunit [Stellaceae bacterium]